jgi:hypothetical protein
LWFDEIPCWLKFFVSFTYEFDPIFGVGVQGHGEVIVRINAINEVFRSDGIFCGTVEFGHIQNGFIQSAIGCLLSRLLGCLLSSLVHFSSGVSLQKYYL